MDLYLVMEEHSNKPIAVCGSPETAFDIARVFNLGGNRDRNAVVNLRTLDAVGPGMYLDIPPW